MSTRKAPVTVAIVQEEDRLNAVAVQTGPGGLKVLWARTSEPGDLDWSRFAQACGLSVGQSGGQRGGSAPRLIVGLRPVGVAFYRLQLPDVPHSQLDAVVRMQMEARLPLAADQIELSWRQIGRVQDHVTVLVAAARRKHIQLLVDQVRPLSPAWIYPSTEALVEAWPGLFDDHTGDQKVLLSMDRRSTQVCLVENGSLADTALIDTGIDQLHTGLEAASAQQQFVLDLRSILDGWPHLPGGKLRPVVLMSDGSERFGHVADLLKSAGIDVSTAVPAASTAGMGIPPDQVYTYRFALALAILDSQDRLEGEDHRALDLLTRIYRPLDGQTGQQVVSTQLASGIAALALAIALLIAYITDLALARRLQALVDRYGLRELKSQLDARQAVARYRPDILALLSQVNLPQTQEQIGPDPNSTDMGGRFGRFAGRRAGGAGGRSGIVLDSFSFKRGQAVALEGTANTPDDLYRFEQQLRKREGIREVVIKKSVQDKQTNRIRFTMNFHYKNFTQKGVK